MYAVVAFIILTIVGGVRGKSVGVDTINYIEIFYDNGVNIKEYGFVILLRLCRYISDSPRLFIIISLAITNFCVIFAVYKYRVNIFFAVFSYVTLYFYMTSFNVIRQYISISILLLSVTYLIEGKKTIYLFLLFLATSFHISAIVGIVFPILVYKKINLLIKVGACVMLIFICIYVYEIINYINGYMPIYKDYFVGGSYAYLTENGGGFQKIVVYGMLYVMWLVTVGDTKYEYLNNIFIIILLLSILSFRIVLITRILWDFSIFLIVCIPLMFRRLQTIVKIGVMSVMWIYMLYLCYYNLEGAGEYVIL